MMEEANQQGSDTIALGTLKCEVEINKLVRAIWGHFLAANILDRLTAPIATGMCNIMSSFPMAYVLCESSYTGTLSDLFEYCTDDINERVTVDFSSCFLAANELRHPLWPCYISEEFGGTDLVFMTMHSTDDSVVGIRSVKLTGE